MAKLARIRSSRCWTSPRRRRRHSELWRRRFRAAGLAVHLSPPLHISGYPKTVRVWDVCRL